MMYIAYRRGEPSIKKPTKKERLEAGAEYLMQKWKARDAAEAPAFCEKLVKMKL
jgi:hypothetical protein